MPQRVIERLFALDIRLDRAIEQLGGSFEGAAGRMARDWQAEATAFVLRLPTAGGHLASRAALPAGRIVGALEPLTTAALQVVGRHLDKFADVSTLTLQGLKVAGQSATLNESSLHVLVAFRALKLAEFREQMDAVVGRVAAAVRKAAVSGQAQAEVIAEVAELVDEWPWRARTLFETAIAEFAQVVTATRATGDPQRRAYLYTGPVDSRIRRFCLSVVGRVFTRATIDAMNNGQLPNTFLTRGGYNCRHQWRDVSAVPELAALADTGRYATPALAALATSMKGFPLARGRRSS
jgi:hypothetical protein